ncbi:MAG: SDR family NAD(P)-dependent oxidoreductase [Cyanobacteria bacterium SZAS TMP-1]|nr:SDR family NAD(P)-dependent oxidoreductase [Cyanobacteria bacterium SZAS TMP-1]
MQKNLVTIVTGGGRGIGRAIALRMSALTSVIVVGRTEADLLAVCAEIQALGGQAAHCVGDVADPGTAQATIDLAASHGWTIRNLVCNAGIGKGGPLHTFSPEMWQKMFHVNVHGTFHFIRACLPAMIEQKNGSISIISSTAGLKGHKNDAAYSATKFALVGLAQSLADEVKKHNITVVPLCPGFVETDMTRRTVAGLVTHRKMTEAEAEALLASVNPQGRILQPEEIAEAVAYCATTRDPKVSGTAMELTTWSEPRVLQLVNWVREHAAPAKKLFIPISGGSDSALAFYLCARAYPEKVTGIFVGSQSKLRARAWFESIAPVLYLKAPRKSKKTEAEHSAAHAEIARWATFLELSNASGAWLVGSRNHTEEYTGLYSLASRVATFLPLANVWKSDVMTLCGIVGVPAEVTSSSRRADPDCGRPQTLAEIPLEAIDTYLKVRTGELPEAAIEAIGAGQIEYLRRTIDQNQFKRSLPTKGPRLLV